MPSCEGPDPQGATPSPVGEPPLDVSRSHKSAAPAESRFLNRNRFHVPCTGPSVPRDVDCSWRWLMRSFASLVTCAVPILAASASLAQVSLEFIGPGGISG